MSLRPTAVSAWSRVFSPRPSARARLYALPYAGGNAAVYRPWALALPDTVELRAVQPPGRHDRISEQPFVNSTELVEAMADALEPELGERPFGVFGHSMGAMLSFELARELRRRGAPAPVLLAVSGWPSPHEVTEPTQAYTLPEDEFIAHLKRLGGMPDEVLSSADLLAFSMPSLRADYQVVGTYRYRDEPPLDSPVSAFGGTSDPMASPDQLDSWQEQTTRYLGKRVYPGGHFYLMAHTGRVLQAVHDDLQRCLAADSAAAARAAAGGAGAAVEAGGGT